MVVHKLHDPINSGSMIQTANHLLLSSLTSIKRRQSTRRDSSDIIATCLETFPANCLQAQSKRFNLTSQGRKQQTIYLNSGYASTNFCMSSIESILEESFVLRCKNQANENEHFQHDNKTIQKKNLIVFHELFYRNTEIAYGELKTN